MYIKKVVFLVFLLSLVFACSKYDNGKNVVINVSTSITNQSVILFYIEKEKLLGENVTLNIKFHKSRQEAVAKIIKEDIDLAYLGAHMIAQLYNKNLPIKFIDINTWATYQLLTSDPNINSIKDLEGQTIWIGDKGGPMDVVATTILDNKNITFKRQKQTEVANMGLYGLKGVKTFVLREPFISKVLEENSNVKVVLKLNKEWEDRFKLPLPLSGTIATNNFLSKNHGLINKFIEAEKKAVKWINENPVEASKLAASYYTDMTEEQILKSLKNSDFHVQSPNEIQKELNVYYTHLQDKYPEQIGTKLPNKGFYEGL